ncbi:MAG: DEAD/DEAH box helicase [Ruminiclostridium sp.]|jgi:ATP-dependent RNA helicase RhlE|nr:DEAD/DEAH box helicase [Ruminiclostridium sp.]
MTSFASLGIEAPILTALTDYGYQNPTVIQEKAIPAGIEGRDILGSAQTGTGKTCAFGVPILQQLANRKGTGIRALILTPTRELAIQIDDNLHAYGKNLPLREAVIFGGVGQTPQVEALKRGVDILTATPGRLLDLCNQKLLDLSHVEIFVLDEADRMLDMGFIHDVRKVIAKLPQKKQTMFFSATLPPEITDLVDSLLHDPVKAAAAPVSSPVEVIRQEICLVDRNNKTPLLVQILQEEQVKNALVFTRTKHGADKVTRDLTRRGVAAAAIHGNKSQTARQESLRRFKTGEIQVLVATDIAARGLDIEELSHVFNYNLPEVPETYIHRIGRTGRAGRGGSAISFCDYGEQPMLRDIEKLLKKPIPRRRHDFPMEVFDPPKKDARGRTVNPEDAEARQAARERKAQSRKVGAPGTPVTPKPAKAAHKTSEPARSKPAAQPMPRGKQGLQNLQAFLDAQPDPDEAVIAPIHQDPLKGEKVMDATARLLSSKPVYQYYDPKKKEKEGGKPSGKRGRGKKEAPKAPIAAAATEKKNPRRREPPKKGAPVPAKHSSAQRSLTRGKGRIPPRPELPQSRQKDSTEQHSLMKPFYINHD